MVLQVFPKRSQDLRHLRHLRESEVKILVAGTPEFVDHFEGLNGKRRLEVRVRPGDTLASIGRRYDTSVGFMERINRRSRNDDLKSGETVIVYADRNRYPAKRAPAGASAQPAAAQSAPSASEAPESLTSAGVRPVAADADADDAAAGKQPGTTP